MVEKQWIRSLRTRTPQEGFELAIKLAQKGVEVRCARSSAG